MRTLLSLTLLGLLAVLSAPAHAAEAEIAILDCSTYNWDHDGDGHAESWNTCATPECGCMCPVAGGILTVAVGGQEKSVAVFASCQSGYGQGSEPATGEGLPVRFTPILWGLPLEPAFQA